MLTSSVESSLSPAEEIPSWQSSLKRAFRSPGALAKYLELEPQSKNLDELDYGFPMLVTREFASRMTKGNWDDPLLRQVWPSSDEQVMTEGYRRDPVGDLEARVASGLLQKYHGRVLMMASGVCAIHCRYCFRRHYPYTDEPKSVDGWMPALDRIANDTSIDEVILSGGDPWMMSDARFSQLVEHIESIPHVLRLRVHTRMPIVLPSRVTNELTARLHASRLATWIVMHSNHARELDHDVFIAIRKLQASGATVLNQAVLLRGVNDTPQALEQLCRVLVNASVLPYYLHHLDPVQGAAHFAVPAEKGRYLIDDLRARLPGYAVPEYVQEVAGRTSKSPMVPPDVAALL